MKKVKDYILNLVFAFLALAISIAGGRLVSGWLSGGDKTELPTKAEYIQTVRQNYPEQAEFMTCSYDKLISEWGLKRVFELDLAYAKSGVDGDEMTVTELAYRDQAIMDCADYIQWSDQ